MWDVEVIDHGSPVEAPSSLQKWPCGPCKVPCCPTTTHQVGEETKQEAPVTSSMRPDQGPPLAACQVEGWGVAQGAALLGAQLEVGS